MAIETMIISLINRWRLYKKRLLHSKNLFLVIASIFDVYPNLEWINSHEITLFGYKY